MPATPRNDPPTYEAVLDASARRRSAALRYVSPGGPRLAYIPKDALWYLADVVLEHTVDGDPCNVVHVNLLLIEADSPERAYEKAIALGQGSEQTFANPEGREVRVTSRGLRDLNMIHDELEDGAELAYEESTCVPEERLSTWLRAREQLSVFGERQAKRELPNYMPGSVMKSLEEAGFSREDIDGEA